MGFGSREACAENIGEEVMATHIYHYNTHAEKRYFLGPEHRDFYDMIALNGNLVSHTPTGIAGFVATAAKDFYIDPQTHAFQHATIHLKRDVSDKEAGEPPRYEFKPSIVKLAKERLQGPFSRVIDTDRPIRPTEFLNEGGNIRMDTIDSICQRVVQFQVRTMFDELDEEARDLIGDVSRLRPKFLIAPYFCLATHRWREWLQINVECYRRTKELSEGLPVYLGLVVSRERLDDQADIANAISKIKADGIVLWIDEHIEEELGVGEINRYVEFLQRLRSLTGTIYNSHGGYLSILLCHGEVGRLLDGIAHAMNYGEHRSVVPIGGGLPMAQFYLLSVHSRLRWGDAASIVQPKGWLGSVGSYRENVCTCSQCVKLIDEKRSVENAFAVYGRSHPVTITRRTGVIVTLNYPTREAKEAATRHYLYNKAKEFRDVEENDFAALLGQLAEGYDSIAEDGGEDFAGHLRTWYKALSAIV